MVKQIWNAPPWPSSFLERVRKVKLKKPNEAYKYWWRELENKLKNYVNKSWFFINAQDDMKQIKKTSDIKITDSFNFEDDIKRYKFRWIDEKLFSKQ